MTDLVRTTTANASTDGNLLIEKFILEDTTNQEMEVDVSSNSNINICIYGIALSTEHLERRALVEKLHHLVSSNSIVLLSSPAASGKSSLYKLYKHDAHNVDVFGISLLDDQSVFEILREEGIDLKRKEISEELCNKKVVFFLDDAQRKYGEVTFWESLRKATGSWIPNNIKFIISATHSLSGESPIEFQSLPKLSRLDFLLTDEEAYQLLECRDIGLPAKIRKHRVLKAVLVKECGGLVGALRLAINSLSAEFFLCKNDDVEETLCLQYCLSRPFVQNMARCFRSGHSYPAGNDFKSFLERSFANEKIQVSGFKNPQDNVSYSLLKKAGILVDFPDSTFGFSSPLAKKYYFNWIYPNRSVDAPTCLRELISKVIANISSTILKNSGNFPKEAVFQQQFTYGLALHTLRGCSICPELSKIFPSDTNPNIQQTTTGKIDFYLNSDIRWGIELLVNCGIGEQVSSFAPPHGKYVPLAVHDYAVVDFRRNLTGEPTNISKHPNRISVFFKIDDYSVAYCFFGEDTTVTKIELAN